MQAITTKLTVYFEEPFWVGVYERTEAEHLEVSRVVFGAEPKDCEVYVYFLTHFTSLHFSPPISAQMRNVHRPNPKRTQRQAKRELSQTGIGTKAQQAIKFQQETLKVLRRENRKQLTEQEKKQRFALKQQKKKQKHRGAVVPVRMNFLFLRAPQSFDTLSDAFFLLLNEKERMLRNSHASAPFIVHESYIFVRTSDRQFP